MSETMQITALFDRSAPDNVLIEMSEVRDRAMIDLRGLASNRKFMVAAKQALGTALPKTPRTSASSGPLTCMWLSVDQWLITCALSEKNAIVEKLRNALDGIHAHACDMSDARTVLRLKGDQVRHVLMKGTSVDFTQREFTSGCVRRMTFADVPALVHIVDSKEETFDLFVFRSQAHHVWDWLALTARAGSNAGLPGNLDQPQTV